MEKTAKCQHCGAELTPARAFWEGEPTYVGFIPCPCQNPIMTDFGVVYPGSEDHNLLLKSKRYSINDILSKPIKYGKSSK